jgi:HTH-type transcriptional regulator/antitoxin HipB
MFRIDNAAQLCSYLRALRKTRGMTQAQLGALVGVSAARISEIELNASTVSFAQILELIHLLGARLAIDDTRTVRESAPAGEW